jgi:hypothetical protein
MSERKNKNEQKKEILKRCRESARQHAWCVSVTDVDVRVAGVISGHRDLHAGVTESIRVCVFNLHFDYRRVHIARDRRRGERDQINCSEVLVLEMNLRQSGPCVDFFKYDVRRLQDLLVHGVELIESLASVDDRSYQRPISRQTATTNVYLHDRDGSVLGHYKRRQCTGAGSCTRGMDINLEQVIGVVYTHRVR